jgi:drug/metabolite transporter (DMT)-like permease
MGAGQASGPGMTWLIFALLTVATWGVYGVLLHTGQSSMGDPVNGRYKAFLFVGIAYFLTAVLAPLAVLAFNGASWSFPVRGMAWSLVAGIAGAVGAFCVLLAFGAKGSPAVVMSIVFAGAPIVNAFTALAIHPPAGGLGALRWQFVLGILMAAAGGYLVVSFKPGH